MYFLGIDPGFARLGFGLVYNPPGTARLQMVHNGVVETAPQLSDGERLLVLETELNAVIKPYQVHSCVMEDVFIKKNLTTGARVLQARGVVLLTLTRHNIPVHGVSPTALKKLIAGSGSADKKQVQNMTARILQLNEIPQPDDAADALGMAICAWLHSRQNKIS